MAFAARTLERLLPRSPSTLHDTTPAGHRTVRPPLRLVAPKPRRRRLGLVVVAVGAGLFAGLLGLTGFQAHIAQDQLRLDRLDRELQDARTYYDRLRLAVAQLESPSYVIPQAQQLGMVPAQSPTYLTPTGVAVQLALASVGTAGDENPADPAEVQQDWREVKRLSGRVA